MIHFIMLSLKTETLPLRSLLNEKHVPDYVFSERPLKI